MKLSRLLPTPDSLFYYKTIPIHFIDYVFAYSIFIIIAFLTALFIDGYVLASFPPVDITKISTSFLMFLIWSQLVLQGFFVICIITLVKYVPSPVKNIYGYNPDGDIGKVLRNPAIITFILLMLSTGLRNRIFELFDRLKKKDYNEATDANKNTANTDASETTHTQHLPK